MLLISVTNDIVLSRKSVYLGTIVWMPNELHLFSTQSTHTVCVSLLADSSVLLYITLLLSKKCNVPVFERSMVKWSKSDYSHRHIQTNITIMGTLV